MLAYYVEWHLKQCLAPLLFEDEEIDDGSLNVIKASRSGLFWFLCGNGVYTDSFFSKIVLKVFASKHFMIL